ncbi:OmpH family outer membrane protein [Allorhodopirellula solitaria]|uniref:Outer membrane protein (OmpH-like) n=1 Tax=Allorhodopirellula solitaria TaxID=2527987 RepID=A0A5C5XW41_9BACT|nr:OmpH family outer membrane protein [Allorhodopirellula solitaria]TWT67547.1 Outer membrane protein (OmpH-like) [Allorhodopirellula solitaria]
MRLLVLSALTLATTTFTVLASTAATAQDTGHRIAVVDVAYIFKNNEGIKAQVKQVEDSLKSFDEELQAKRNELKSAAEKLKTFQPGSADYISQEEAVASMESKLRLEMARKRKELADREAKIYFDNYQIIAAGVKTLAEYHKVNLVLRYNSEEMNLEQGESVIRGVMKNIVYHDEAIDMTNGTMAYLDRALKVATNPAPERQ